MHGYSEVIVTSWVLVHIKINSMYRVFNKLTTCMTLTLAISQIGLCGH